MWVWVLLQSLDTLLFGNSKYSFLIKSEIFMNSISYTWSTMRFDGSLMWKYCDTKCFPFLFKLGSWWSFGNMGKRISFIYIYIFFFSSNFLWLTEPLYQRFVFSFHCIFFLSSYFFSFFLITELYFSHVLPLYLVILIFLFWICHCV